MLELNKIKKKDGVGKNASLLLLAAGNLLPYIVLANAIEEGKKQAARSKFLATSKVKTFFIPSLNTLSKQYHRL